MHVLVTGAAGFVGRALCAELCRRGHAVRAACRRDEQIPSLPPEAEPVVIGLIDARTDWAGALAGCDSVVHLAARVHLMQDDVSDPLSEFRKVNTEGTMNLARQAAAAGARRFVFMSSIKVNGEGGYHSGQPTGKAYTEMDEPAPSDAYAVSKWEAEAGLMAIARATGMEVVVLRPPLVYGPDVGANFLRLMRLVAKGIPLPFGAIDNRRSLLYLGNLVAAINLSLTHPAAANQIYLVSDGEDVSTTDLIRRLASLMGKQLWLLPLPPRLLGLVAGMLGKSAEAERLIGSLVLDSGKIRRELGWRPPFGLDVGLAETVRRYRQQRPR